MKLSKECIEAIEETNEYKMCGASGASYTQKHFMQGAKIAITNPSIFSKAGLISLEDALEFAEWVEEDSLSVVGKDRYLYNRKWYTVAQLFQIYQEQKEK